MRLRIVRRWLRAVYAYCDGRIQCGDLDLDDVLYRRRDAAAVLLEMFGDEIQDV